MSHPSIDHETLRDYREDREALKRFESRFARPCLLGGLIFVLGLITAIFFDRGSPWAIGFAVVGLMLLVLGLLAMYVATPTSQSGKPMVKYWNASARAKGNEMVYVCEDSRTYFRRTWAKNSGGTR